MGMLDAFIGGNLGIVYRSIKGPIHLSAVGLISWKVKTTVSDSTAVCRE